MIRYDRPVKMSSVVLGTGSLGAVEEVSSAVSSWRMSVLDALQVTMDTVFSSDALKVVVIVDCHLPGCNKKESWWSSDSLQELLGTLLQQGVQVHVFTSDELSVTQPDDLSSRSRRRLLGLDSVTSYSTSHARKRRLRGNRDLRPAMAPPPDNLCAQLAVQSGGSVWTLPAFERIKKRQRRHQALVLPALRIMRGLGEPYLQCRLCPCVGRCPAPCDEPCVLCVPPPALPLNPV
ncbi:hypothetical protein FHG87_015270, partial [Trinorchestia longiramus]